jgi:protein SCO1/2
MLFAIALLAVLASPLLPVHGTVSAPAAHGTYAVRFDAVTGMLPAQTRVVRVEPAMRLPAGTGIDGFLQGNTLRNAFVAARFVPGLPETGKVFPIDYGSALPHTTLVDQDGQPVDLAASFPGRVQIIGFMFTRCPDQDECPLLTAKFARLQTRLDPRRFHIVEITLDPVYDSPWVLHRYAKRLGARASSWSVVTGQQHEIAHLLDRFGISSLRVNDARFIHNDKVFLTDSNGKVADIVQTTGFSDDALTAQARHLAGMASSPLGRLQLAIVAGAIALCGGSQFAGIVLLETVTFLIIAFFALFALSWIARKLIHNA